MPLGWDLHTQASLNVTETDEPFDTFVENALRKARNAAAQTGLPALADDSGICVPSLGGEPGVFSARYASRSGKTHSLGNDAANNEHLVSQLAFKADRRAYYYCVLVWINSPSDPCPVIADGRWWGEVIDQPKGSHGFGYDSHFLISEMGRTVAELSSQEKNDLSHRAKALGRLIEMIS